jgi:putative copper resistance protein D
MLLVMSAPVTLGLRTLTPRTDGSRGPREWLLALVHSRVLSVLAHPAVAGALFIGSLFVFYYSPLFELSLSTHTGHLLMSAHFLAVGYLFAWVLMGPDPGPARAGYPVRVFVLLLTVSAHAFFALGIMAATTVLAQDWFVSIGRGGDVAALLADQHTGGAIAWGLAELPTLVMLVIVAYQWSRSEDRAAARADRQADRDGDAELAAYNAYLSKLPERD